MLRLFIILAAADKYGRLRPARNLDTAPGKRISFIVQTDPGAEGEILVPVPVSYSGQLFGRFLW